MQRGRRGSRGNNTSNDSCATPAAAPAKVKTSHPGVELLLGQRRLRWMKRAQKLRVP